MEDCATSTQGGGGVVTGDFYCRSSLEGTLEVVNCRIDVEVNFYDVLYGLLEGRGTGTTPLKSKLPHQLTAMREAVI